MPENMNLTWFRNDLRVLTYTLSAGTLCVTSASIGRLDVRTGHPDEVPLLANEIPDLFTQFRKKWKRKSKVRLSVEAPTYPIKKECI